MSRTALLSRSVLCLLLWVLAPSAGLVAFVPGCRGDEEQQQPPRSTLETVQMRIGDRTFTLEIADTPETQAYGLMNRKSLPPDRGMIFVFPDEKRRSFWMRNTLIPLDILYLNEAGRVMSIAQLKAMDENGVPSAGAAKYAIELNKGMAEEVGVEVGDILDIPAAAREPRAR